MGCIAEHAGTVWTYHHPDALGSVRQLTDGAGTLSLSRAYTPYGEPLSSLGGGTSSYGYNTPNPGPSP